MVSRKGMVNKLPYLYYNKNYAIFLFSTGEKHLIL